jgi:hypothetical protein
MYSSDDDDNDDNNTERHTRISYSEEHTFTTRSELSIIGSLNTIHVQIEHMYTVLSFTCYGHLGHH